MTQQPSPYFGAPAPGWVHRPERSHDEPLYRQVTDTITAEIESGRLPPGSMLPPEPLLARQLGVSRYTLRAGLEALVRAGRLERHRGKGTFVTHPRIQQSLARFYSVAHEMSARGARLDTQVLHRGLLPPDHALARLARDQLGHSTHTIGLLERLRLVGGVPLLLEWITFPANLCPVLLAEPEAGTADLAAMSFYDVLQEHAGVVVTEARETLRPLTVSGREARLLHVPARTAVFQVDRLSVAAHRPVEWRRALVRGDRYSYVVDLVNPSDIGPSA
jgi:GntR family transcriptional regulator